MVEVNKWIFFLLSALSGLGALFLTLGYMALTGVISIG